jgi:hypothetical protein
LPDTSAQADTPEQSERRRWMIAVAKAGQFETVLREQYPQLVYGSRVSNQRLRSAYLSMAFDCGAERFVRHQQAILDRPDALVGRVKFVSPLRFWSALRRGSPRPCWRGKLPTASRERGSRLFLAAAISRPLSGRKPWQQP